MEDTNLVRWKPSKEKRLMLIEQTDLASRCGTDENMAPALEFTNQRKSQMEPASLSSHIYMKGLLDSRGSMRFLMPKSIQNEI